VLLQLTFEKVSRNLEDQLSEIKSKSDEMQRELNEVNAKFARLSSEKVSLELSITPTEAFFITN